MNEFITLAHGNGGRFMRELIRDVFARHLANPDLDISADAASLPVPDGTLVFTTDGFIVEPLEFPGGDIGALAVHGVVNDLSVMGATPRWLSLSCFVEEGFEIARLERIVTSLGNAARNCDVAVVTGDTKIVPRGQGGGLYLAVSGIGWRATDTHLGLETIKPGDCVLVNGTLGDHGTAIILARNEFGLHGGLHSDCASVFVFAQAATKIPGLRFMRDPTRGGIATVANEISSETRLRVVLDEAFLPLREEVRGICDMLGFDPLYLASEGRVVAVIDPAYAEVLLASWRRLPGGDDAAIIGRIETGRPIVVLRTTIGGERLLDELEDDPLPRIC